MKALLVVPRLPGTGFTGDRVRAELHLRALSAAGFEVTLVGGAPSAAVAPAPALAARVLPVAVGWRTVGPGLLRAARRGDALQTALTEGRWDRALAAAGHAFDLVVVVLARLWPHVEAHLPRAPLVVDFVDALSLAARQAAVEEPSAWRRRYWRHEVPRLALLEAAAARRARIGIATTDADAAALPGRVEVVPNGVEIGPTPPTGRGPVVAFSGRLRYRPNALAAERLVREVWPLVRAGAPGAELHLGGADAPGWLRRVPEGTGVRVESPVADMPAFLRTARVAVVSVALGTGTPNKLFEALEAGTPVVASPEAVSRATLGGQAPPASVADGAEETAAALVKLLSRPGEAEALGAAGRRFAVERADRGAVVRRLAALLEEAAGAA